MTFRRSILYSILYYDKCDLIKSYLVYVLLFPEMVDYLCKVRGSLVGGEMGEVLVREGVSWPKRQGFTVVPAINNSTYLHGF